MTDTVRYILLIIGWAFAVPLLDKVRWTLMGRAKPNEFFDNKAVIVAGVLGLVVAFICMR